MSTNDDPNLPPEPDESGGQSDAERRRTDGAPQPNPFEGMTGTPPPMGTPVLTGEQALEAEEAEPEMGFFDHLEELRWRIIKSVIALIVAAIACGVFLDTIIEDLILGPAHNLTPPLILQNLEVMGTITLALQVALISGLLLAIPFILFQLWGFIKPGLYENERRMSGWMTVATIFCFLAGVGFAYFVMIPTSLGFANKVTFNGIKNSWTISSYFSFVLGFTLICGVVFEMPVLSFGLARFGVIAPAFLRKYRRHAVVIILIIAAIVTPTPDPFNQLLLAAPLYGLYEISIYVAHIGSRQRKRAGNDESEPRIGRWKRAR